MSIGCPSLRDRETAAQRADLRIHQGGCAFEQLAIRRVEDSEDLLAGHAWIELQKLINSLTCFEKNRCDSAAGHACPENRGLRSCAADRPRSPRRAPACVRLSQLQPTRSRGGATSCHGPPPPKPTRIPSSPLCETATTVESPTAQTSAHEVAGGWELGHCLAGDPC